MIVELAKNDCLLLRQRGLVDKTRKSSTLIFKKTANNFLIFKTVPTKEESFLADQKGPRKMKRSPADDSVLDPSPPLETGLSSQKSNTSNYSSSSAPSNSQHDSDYVPPDEDSNESKGAKPKREFDHRSGQVWTGL